MNLCTRIIYFLALIVTMLILACQNAPKAADETDEVKHPKDFTNIPISQENTFKRQFGELNRLGMDTTQKIPQGLKAGTKAPVFRGIDQNGKTVSLKEKLTKGSVVLLFYRGEWCGICNRHMAAFADSLDMVQQNGTSVIAVTPERPEYAQKTVEKTGLNIPVISDKDLTIMKAYDVAFHVNKNYQDKVTNHAKNTLPNMHDSDDAFLPVPATYIINPSGIISYVHFDQNYRNRLSVSEILMSL